MPQNKHPAVSPFVQAVPPLNLLLIHNRHKHVGEEKQYASVKLRRRYSENCKRIFVQPDDAAHHTAVIWKMAVPIAVAQHYVRCAVRAMLIGAMEKTPQVRLNA